MHKTVLVIGSTGLTGQNVLWTGLKYDLDVVALARTPKKLENFPGKIIKGDVLDSTTLDLALSGVDVVICTLGTPLILRGPVTLLSEGTRNLISAMKRNHVRRLICVTGMGAGDSRGHGGFVYDQLVRPLLLGRIYADKDRQEDLVRSSGLDWTLVRPAMLTNGLNQQSTRIITNWEGQPKMTQISRTAVAYFLVSEAILDRYINRCVNISE